MDDERIAKLRAPILAGGIFLVGCILTIAPWTLRNCLAYERCILVETGLSYNLWAFNEPREDMQTIFRTLEAIRDPAERAEEATARGLERLREDPGILLRKLWPNWVHLWRVKIIQDRFLLADYASDPPPLVFLSSLLLDDALYVVILIASVAGISRALWRERRMAPLLAAWLVYVVGIMLLTHGESRYRHFLFPIMIPYAALCLTGLRFRFTAGSKAATIATLAALPLIGLLLYTVAISYPWEWAREGTARSVHRLRGDIAWVRGDLDAAAMAYERALAANETPDGWIALGDVRRAQGDLQRAETAYRAAWRREPDYIPASARLGDLLRALGRYAEARDAFEGRYVADRAVLDWSWANLDPPPTASIDVGAGLDFGYVSGMYAAERQQGATARWTDGRGRLRLAVAPPDLPLDSAPVLLRIRLAAPHPGTSEVAVRICTADRCQPVVLERTWRTIVVRVPAAQHIIEVRSPTFIAPDGRELGVLVDRAKVKRGMHGPS